LQHQPPGANERLDFTGVLGCEDAGFWLTQPVRPRGRRVKLQLPVKLDSLTAFSTVSRVSPVPAAAELWMNALDTLRFTAISWPWGESKLVCRAKKQTVTKQPKGLI
jgi:hypothetical protein